MILLNALNVHRATVPKFGPGDFMIS